MMELLANENIPVASVILLRNLGHNVLYVAEESFGIADTEVIQIAKENGRLIITMDRDYGELVFKKGLINPAGVVGYQKFSIPPLAY